MVPYTYNPNTWETAHLEPALATLWNRLKKQNKTKPPK